MLVYREGTTMYHPKNWPWVHGWAPRQHQSSCDSQMEAWRRCKTAPFFDHFPRVSRPGFPYFFDSFCMSHVRKILIPGHNCLFFLLIYFGNMYFWECVAWIILFETRFFFRNIEGLIETKSAGGEGCRLRGRWFTIWWSLTKNLWLDGDFISLTFWFFIFTEHRLSAWWFGTWILFSIIYDDIWDVILPIDELICFKMVKTTNQLGYHHY